MPGELLCSLEEALAVPGDIVVEAIGGVREAFDALAAALRLGRHVITANKGVIAARGPELRALAEEEGARLSYSAAVGGVVPVLETLRGLRGQVAGVEGVLNGTSNFVLDRLAAGENIDAAVAEARRLGYAEADPTDDLSGKDAARKLALIALEGFGALIDAETIPIPGVAAIASWRGGSGQPIGRLIASVRRREDGCAASVELALMDAGHPLARCHGASNAVVITLRSGRTIELRGRGAGRWPTAESVVGDLLELWRDLQQGKSRRGVVLGEFEAVAS